MFVDEKVLHITAGKGGDGAILFRREKYVPHGGPDGGDGGDGGNVYLVGQRNLHALTHLAHTSKVDAEPGLVGGHRKSTGRSGEDVTIAVPLGTEVYIVSGAEEVKGWEVVEEGERIRIAKGGNGGWGNWRFRSSVQQAPDHSNPGQPGQELTIHLVLKLIADIGLVGLPNAGKSTLLSVISAARPKIADYPFTTTEPQLGVAQVGKGSDIRQVVVADLPGLIEGASQGKGLGARFLKHIERTRTIVHCLDASNSVEEIIANYQTVRQELVQWSEVLASKPERVILTKGELISDEEKAERVAAMQQLTSQPILVISAVTGLGVSTLLTSI